MTRKLHSIKHYANGIEIIIEVENAYTDGRSRLDRYVVPLSEIGSGTRQEVAAALRRIIRQHEGLRALRGLDVENEPETKAVWEQRAIEAHATWQRWKTTREEAQARALPAAVRTALTNREDAAWQAYVQILNAWRQA